LVAAVALNPVSVAIEADKAVFQSYKSGIISSTACGTTLDHGVLVVGYTSDAWILRTHGEPPGENLDSSELQRAPPQDLESAVFNKNPHTPKNELHNLVKLVDI